MKAAIIGATGQLGSDLVNVFKESIPLGHAEIEVKDLSTCFKVLEKHQPDVAINCAAYVRVDDAEDFADEAFAVNAIGARNVAIACEKIGAVNAYISTDYVFDGGKNRPYVETDLPNPINAYGISKYAGEIFTKNYSSKYYIFRLASLYGAKGARGKGGNFVETIIRKAKNDAEIRVVNDIIVSPTYTHDAAVLIEKLLEMRAPYGVYHISNEGHCSWYTFAQTVFKILNLSVNIKPIVSEGYKTKAKRPKKSSLDSEKLKRLKIPRVTWKDGLKKYLKKRGHLKT